MFIQSTIFNLFYLFSLQWHHQLKYLETNDLYTIASDSPKTYEYFNYTLNNIMIPRVSGTEGNRKVREVIKSSLISINSANVG